MFVMDDGWFGKREDDTSGLGDWFVNEKKIKGGLGKLVERINQMGMKFGIWFEPEAVSEDSELYRAHPDWCLAILNRKPNRSRYELILDMARADVREYLFQAMCEVLDSANIEYVKWDMNRNLSDVWSAYFPKDRQGEIYHRYVLGLDQRLFHTAIRILLSVAPCTRSSTNCFACSMLISVVFSEPVCVSSCTAADCVF